MSQNARLSLLFLAVYVAVCLDANPIGGQLTITPTTGSDSCTVMTPDILRYCGFNRTCTILPNAKGHKTLKEAKDEFDYFLPLIDRARCSPLLQVFLCFYYFPIVPPQAGRSGTLSGQQFLPCRSVCESVRDSCEPSIIEHRPEVGGWPDHLNCSNFPDDSSACIKPATPPSTTASPKPTTAPTTTDYSGESSGSGENSSTTSPSTTSPSLGVCIKPNTDQSTTCSCAKVRPNISKATIVKGKYSFVARVKILSNITLSTQRGKDIVPVVGYLARIEENFPVSCSTANLQAGTEVTLQTGMSPDCLCAIIEVNQVYVVAGYATTKTKVIHVPTHRGIKYGKNGGCVFGCWESRHGNNINRYLRETRPLNCSS